MQVRPEGEECLGLTTESGHLDKDSFINSLNFIPICRRIDQSLVYIKYYSLLLYTNGWLAYIAILLLLETFLNDICTFL